MGYGTAGNGLGSEMNEIEKDGKSYRYDPDYDCWYRVFSKEEYDALPHMEKYGWLYVCAICLVIGVMASI